MRQVNAPAFADGFRRPSDDAQRAQTGMAVTADDDMIMDGNAKGLGGGNDIPGDGDVGLAGGGIAAGVVVDNDYGAGAQFQGAFDDLAGVDGGLVDGAVLMDLVGNQGTAIVEEQQMQALCFFECVTGMAVGQDLFP